MTSSEIKPTGRRRLDGTQPSAGLEHRSAQHHVESGWRLVLGPDWQHGRKLGYLLPHQRRQALVLSQHHVCTLLQLLLLQMLQMLLLLQLIKPMLDLVQVQIHIIGITGAVSLEEYLSRPESMSIQSLSSFGQ